MGNLVTICVSVPRPTPTSLLKLLAVASRQEKYSTLTSFSTDGFVDKFLKRCALMQTEVTASSVTCFKCGESGHYMRECPQTNPNQSAKAVGRGKPTGKVFHAKPVTASRVEKQSILA